MHNQYSAVPEYMIETAPLAKTLFAAQPTQPASPIKSPKSISIRKLVAFTFAILAVLLILFALFIPRILDANASTPPVVVRPTATSAPTPTPSPTPTPALPSHVAFSCSTCTVSPHILPYLQKVDVQKMSRVITLSFQFVNQVDGDVYISYGKRGDLSVVQLELPDGSIQGKNVYHGPVLKGGVGVSQVSFAVPPTAGTYLVHLSLYAGDISTTYDPISFMI